MELWQILGALHPKLVQFPLVLLLAGLLFDAVGWVRRSERSHWAGLICTSAGTVLLLVAFICGIYAEIWAGRAGVPQDPIEWHEFLANVASWGFVLLAAWRLLLTPERRRSLAAYVCLGFGWYVLLGLTAWFGGQLVFQYGAAVAGARANTVLSLHDLNTLATRQTDLNLKYSEMMHHIFGWLTLALSGSLLANAVFPKHTRKLWWVAPALLLAGGIFLFFCADLDLYRLTDLRQLRDREVQLHKTIALALATIGVVGLRLRPGRRAAAATADNAALPPAPASAAGVQSKVIAVMALIGGGMLFTHVHTVAPYANVAAGVYIAHMVLGLTALSVGATRLLQDKLPRYRPPLATAFALLMCVESVLLITYNEGLPWYIGYGRYNRWGPHGGTVAPYGPLRAELTYDNVAQRLDCYLLDRFTDQPVRVRANPVTLLVAQGYQEVGVPLNPADRLAPATDHFTAVAPWMKDTAAFSARLALPVKGESLTMGYFDPWVSPVIAAVPPNETARYQCPMHDGVLAEKPGDCPLCGMQLVPIETTARDWLHTADFGLSLNVGRETAFTVDTQSDPASIRPDPLDRLLTFRPSHAGSPLPHLPIVHDHPLHLTIVSADLSFFEHVHPVPQPDGSLQLRYHFPAPGDYVLFGEYTPMGERNQIFRFPVHVAGEEPRTGNLFDTNDAARSDRPTDELLTPATEAPLTPDPSLTKPIASDPSMTAQLILQPRTLTAGTHALLLFRLARDGQPVTDLQPYMGAMGHCAIVSQDSQLMIHSHPEQLYPPHPDTRGGPDIAFHAAFPHPGTYKVWGQFLRSGKVVVADFVVNVERPLLPAKVVNFILND